MPIAHVLYHKLDQFRIDRKIRKTLGDIDGAMIGGHLAHYGEDSSAYIGQFGLDFHSGLRLRTKIKKCIFNSNHPWNHPPNDHTGKRTFATW